MKHRTKTSETRARLEGAFTAIARGMADKHDIVIRASGTALCTDGQTITFPWNADDIDSIPFDVLNGYLDHEVGHIVEERKHRQAGRETPLQVMKRQPKTMQMLMNVFEDIRMEIAWGRDYIGVAQNLHAANLYSVEQHREMHRKASTPPNFWHTLGCGIILAARGCDTSWLPETYNEYMALCAPEIAQSQMVSWAQDSHKLAESVYNKVKAAAEDILKEEEARRAKEREERKKRAKPSAEDGNAEDGDDMGGAEAGEGDEGAAGEPGGASASAPSSDEDEGAEGAPGGSVGSDGEGGPSDDEAEAGGGSPRAEQAKEALDTEATEAHLTDAVGDAIKEASEGRVKRDPYIPNPNALKADRWIKPHEHNKAVYDSIKQSVSAQTSALRTRLMRVIRTLTDARTVHDQDRGRLDTRSLHQLRLGNTRIFSVDQKAIELDTAVLILVDMSGSMGHADSYGTKAYFARATCVALSEAFDALGVPFEVIGFHNTGYALATAGFINRTPLEFHVFKAFGETFKKVRTRMVGITGLRDNSDGEAVWQAALRLADRPEPRKLMFVVSDGEPACAGVPWDLGKRHLKDTVKKITAAGIEVFGIGVEHKAVAAFYPEHVVINKIDTMAADIFKIVSKRLTAHLKQRVA
jgi:cobalamin biosynthesis protein CobT